MKFSTLLAFALATSGTQAGAADRFDAAREYIRGRMLEANVPSVSVALSQRGKIIWEESFGWADREQRIAATPHTLYSLASISKPITATALMTLVEAGKLDLDHPINDYLGPAKLTARVGSQGATVRQVANHSSGLPLHYQFFYADEPYGRLSMDETILRYGNLVTAPGEKLEYSNLGYGVLDHVISRVSGKSFAAYLTENVFLPLGLTRMSLGIGPGLESYAAIRYAEDGTALPFYDSDHQGASGVYGSAHDLIRFAMFHLQDGLADQKRILSRDAITQMQRVTFAGDDREGYGVAWEVVERADGYRVVEHGGSMPGVGVVLLLIPAHDVAVTVLTNQRYGLHRPIADEILKVVLPKWRPAQAQQRRATVTAARESHSGVEAATTLNLTGKWTGAVHTYRGDVPLTLEFLPTGEVHAQLQSQRQSLVTRVRIQDDEIHGEFIGKLGTEETLRRGSNVLSLSLKRRGSVLNGGVTARSEDWRSSALTYWTEVRME